MLSGPAEGPVNTEKKLGGEVSWRVLQTVGASEGSCGANRSNAPSARKEKSRKKKRRFTCNNACYYGRSEKTT